MSVYSFFFFNDTATTEIYTLSLHDALPISVEDVDRAFARAIEAGGREMLAPDDFPGGRFAILGDPQGASIALDRKSTRLNSSHSQISYAVFCLKKKKIR